MIAVLYHIIYCFFQQVGAIRKDVPDFLFFDNFSVNST